MVAATRALPVETVGRSGCVMRTVGALPGSDGVSSSTIVNTVADGVVMVAPPSGARRTKLMVSSGSSIVSSRTGTDTPLVRSPLANVMRMGGMS